MDEIDDKFILEQDDLLMKKGLRQHQRKFHILIAWLRRNNCSVNIGDPKIWEPIDRAYARLFPSIDTRMPHHLEAGVGIRDRMYPTKVFFVFGTVKIDMLDCIEISKEELEVVYQRFPDQFWRAFYGVYDLWDISYGIDDLKGINKEHHQMLINARDHIATNAKVLSGDQNTSASIQAACLSVELALKGVLLHLGVPMRETRNMGHDLGKLISKLANHADTSVDSEILSLVENFPNYSQTRYSSHRYTKFQLVDLAMNAQFIVSEAIRQISHRNMVKQLSSASGVPKRLASFYTH